MNAKQKLRSIRNIQKLHEKILTKIAISEKAAKVMSPLPPLSLLPKLRNSKLLNFSPEIAQKKTLTHSRTPEPEYIVNTNKIGILIGQPKYLSSRLSENCKLNNLQPLTPKSKKTHFVQMLSQL